MKKLIMLVFAACVLISLAMPLTAAEFRGLWADAWRPGFKSADETSAMVARAKECGFNALFVQVRKRGDVYYRSSLEPMALDIAPGYDPLADVIAKAHAAGIQVHAWISVYEVYNKSKWVKPEASAVHKSHPDWVMKSKTGAEDFGVGKVYLDPGSPQVQAYLAKIVREIVRNYNVDGVHLDILRYPGPDSGYNESSVARFNKDAKRTGVPDVKDAAWCDWRRAQVTKFVEAAHAETSHGNRKVALSAAVSESRITAYDMEFVDWPSWLKSGILDFAVPMIFAKDDRIFNAMVADALDAAGGRTVYIGQGGYKMSAQQSVSQITSARKAGVPGVVVYSYACCTVPTEPGDSPLLDILKIGLFK